MTQHFVDVALNEVLKEVSEIPPFIIIESDNCSNQYKSAAHFNSIQNITDKHQCNVLQLFDIAQHRKGKENHVGGVAKTAIR